MTPNDESDPIARRAREVFAAAADGLDAGTANRLRLARRSALASTSRPMRFAPLAVATAVALALVAWWAGQRAQVPAPAPVAVQPPAPAPVVAPKEAAPREAPAVPSPEPAIVAIEPAPAIVDEESVPADEPEWAALEDEDVELYAWLADAPVAPDDDGDAL